MTVLYDRIGRSYAATRAADPRIVARLAALLDLSGASVICDVGAGSGNYSNALADLGHDVIAIEPAATMRAQSHPHPHVSWREGVAEALPIDDAAAAGVICTLAAHHFSNPEQALTEMARVCPNGAVVFFTLDPRRRPITWIEQYFPPVRQIDLAAFMPARRLLELGEAALGRAGAIEPFPLPADLTDNFLFAAWQRPEAYLDPGFRANASGFATADQSVIEAGADRLERDLRTGAWDAAHGHLRDAKVYEAGFYFAHFAERAK